MIVQNKKLKIPEKYRDTSTSATCLFSISLRKFSRLDELASIIYNSMDTFKTCDVVLCDSLQRYNFIWQKNFSSKQAHIYANELGLDWTKWCLSLFDSTGESPKIIRWDDWLTKEQFHESLTFVEELYQNDIFFKNAVEESLNRYLTRYALKHPHIDINLAHTLSVDFIKEEVAVLALQAQEGYNFELFLEKRNPALQYFYQKFVWSNYPDTLKPILFKINF